MGIGNTTTSSAVAAVFLGRPVEDMTGRGAGLSGGGLVRKINAIKKANLATLHNPMSDEDIFNVSKIVENQVEELNRSANVEEIQDLVESELMNKKIL